MVIMIRLAAVTQQQSDFYSIIDCDGNAVNRRGIVSYVEQLADDIIVYTIGEMKVVDYVVFTLLRRGYVRSSRAGESSFSCIMTTKGRFISLKWKKNGYTYALYNIMNLYRGSRASLELVDYMRMLQEAQVDKPTIGSQAVSLIDVECPKRCRYFPPLPTGIQSDMRLAYAGGYMFAHKGEYGHGYSYDINSLYPACMSEELLPSREPILFEGEYRYDSFRPLYMQRMFVRLRVKKDGIPFLPDFRRDWGGNLRLLNSNGFVELLLTNVDMELMKENYEYFIGEYRGGYKFATVKGFFNNFILPRYAKKTLNPSVGVVEKGLLNAAIGRYGAYMSGKLLEPELKDNSSVEWLPYKASSQDFYSYLPLPAFVNAYARKRLLYYIKKYREHVIYADTDSIVSTEKLDVPISKKMGDFKIEREFDKLRILDIHKYAMQLTDGSTHVCLSGNTLKNLDYDTFVEGATLEARDGSMITL